MIKKFRDSFKREAGFTLIELLVVIAVLGILAAIAIPRLGGVTDKARMTEAVSAMGSIKTALEMNAVENDGYPGDAGYNGTDFNDVIDQYLTDFTPDGSDVDKGTWGDWTITYTRSDDGDFVVRIEDTDQGDGLYVGMRRNGSSYTDVKTNIGDAPDFATN